MGFRTQQEARLAGFTAADGVKRCRACGAINDEAAGRCMDCGLVFVEVD